MQHSLLLAAGGSLRVLDLSCSSLAALPHLSGLTALSSLNLSWCVAHAASQVLVKPPESELALKTPRA
jgi:hypothetical protein